MGRFDIRGNWARSGTFRHRLVLAVLLFGAVLALRTLGRGPAVFAAQTPGPCNDHLELCDRRLDQVVFAASHNAMNASALDWLWPNQDEAIPAQLRAGVRAFLLDTHYWETRAELKAYVASLPPADRTEAADRIVEPSTRPSGVYLCHMMCGAGNTELAAGLREFKTFLDANRREVVILDIEDHVSPADTEAAFRAAGLTGYVYTHPDGTPWPTLRQLIRSNQRLIVGAEHAGPPPAWYAHFYAEAWDTPWAVTSPDQFSCAAGRGDTRSALFLLNHWIAGTVPQRSDAAQVNSAESLLAHARACEAADGRLPTLIAVNFVSTGDLLRVVDVLNGVASK